MATIQPIEDLLPRAGGSVYRLARMAANRALELSDGKPPLVEIPQTDKITTIALEEIRQGKVHTKNGSSKESKKEDN